VTSLFQRNSYCFRDGKANTTLSIVILGCLLTTFNRAALQYIIQQVKAGKPGIEIFIHGYDYAIPDGRPVFKAPFGWDFIGPWLLPAFERQRTSPAAARQKIINQLIDMHNQTIADLASADPQVHHIDCRGVLDANTTDWANELPSHSERIR
jgi:hypothetical protein